jgi:hypothetical protein
MTPQFDVEARPWWHGMHNDGIDKFAEDCRRAPSRDRTVRAQL